MEERVSSSLHLRVAAVPISPYSQIPKSTSCHSRSLSQPAFFSLDSLPPLSPLPWHRRSTSDTPPPPPFGALPPKPAGHNVESQGEVSVSAYMGVIRDDLGSGGSSRASASASENEAESSSAPGKDIDIGPTNSPNLPQQSMNAFSLDFGNADEFNAAELNKIMANQKLAQIALTDPKRVKRILANRQSAARSKERKVRYISELEHKVQTLQSEATTLSAQLTLLQRDSAGLNSQNNELKFRLQAMEQQAHLRDALNEALTAEVKRLKLATGELSDETQSSSFAKQLSNYSQMHQHSTKLSMSQQNNSSVTKDVENE